MARTCLGRLRARLTSIPHHQTSSGPTQPNPSTTPSSNSSSSAPNPTSSTSCSTSTNPPTTRIRTPSASNTCSAAPQSSESSSPTSTPFPKSFGLSASGLRVWRFCRSCLCCSGRVARIRLQRIISLRWGRIGRCIFRTGFGGMCIESEKSDRDVGANGGLAGTLRRTAISIRSRFLRDWCRRCFTRTSSTSTGRRSCRVKSSTCLCKLGTSQGEEARGIGRAWSRIAPAVVLHGAASKWEQNGVSGASRRMEYPRAREHA